MRTGKPVDPVKAAKRKKRNDFLNRYSLLITFLCSFAGYFLIEAMARHSFALAFTFLDDRTKVFFYNVLIIFVTLLPAYLFRKRAFYRVLVSVVWLLLGVTNGVVLANRVTPLTGPDFRMLDDALRVSGKYFSVLQMIMVAAAVVVLILLLIFYLIVSPKFTGRRRPAVWIPVLALSVLAMTGLTKLYHEKHLLSSYFSNIANAYLDYGFPYSFGVTVFDTGISEPNGYSEELVAGVIRGEGPAAETELSDPAPNIIVVQLESFFDPSRVRWLRFSEDPVPNWHALSEKYSSGLYTVPTVGAGTVNTEFETVTGMSLRFFGAGEYPYKGILLKDTCESAAYVLGNLGYTAHAIHNNEADFYGRKDVYSNLGFSSFTSGEYMNTQNDVNANGWMRDRNLIPCITDALDATDNEDFVFVVSVQPHGAYPTEPVTENPVITVSGTATQEEKYAWEYYVNEIHEEDQFVADLIAELESRGEPAVVLFYGDHLPTMGLTDRDIRGRATVFETDYLIWDNLGLERKSQTLTSYQGVAEVMNRLGIHEGTMFRYQQTMKKRSTYFYNMQILQYDLLYGKRYAYGLTNPWSRTILAMGEKGIRVDKIQKMSPEGIYYVLGQNFTQSCRFTVNGEVLDTTYLSADTLLVRGIQLEKGDWVGVSVLSNSGSHEILGSSNTLVYGVGRLTDTAREEGDD